MSKNQQIVEKTITSSNVTTTNGGKLTPEQQTRFIALVRRYGNLLPLVRFVRMGRPDVDIDKLHIGEPVTTGASENTGAVYSQAPKFNKITLHATKVRSDWSMTTELLQSNIEQDQFEATIFEKFAQRMATDFEMLGVQGDTALTGTTPHDLLLKVQDGWDVKSDSGHILDVDGGNLSKAVFSAMRRQIPKEFKGDAGLRWFVGSDLAVDWLDTLADRATGLGDDAMRGVGIAPYGIPMIETPTIPDNKTATGLSVASSAYLMGKEYEPFEFSAADNLDRMTIDVDGFSPDVTVTFIANDDGQTTLNGVEVAKAINDALVTAHGAGYASVARVTSDGRMYLVSPTTGTSSSITLSDPDSPDSVTSLLGFETVTDTGLAAGSGETADASFIWLLNPQNLIWAVLDGTRIYTEFNRDADRIETTVFNQVACEIENLQAIVKAINIRKK